MSWEQDTFSFIVRIWYETAAERKDQPVWRGSIDYVGQNKRLYFQDLDGIKRFIQEQAGLNRARKNGLSRRLLRTKAAHEKPRD